MLRKNSMDYHKLEKQILSKYPNNLIFRFSADDYSLIALGYPHLRAFISAKEGDLWFEVSLDIDLSTRQIRFPRNDLLKTSARVENLRILSINDMNAEEPEGLFFSTIPDDIIRTICLYNTAHWEILKAIAQYGKKLILLISTNPVLAFILINIDRFNKSYSLYNDITYINTLIGHKQKDILRIARFPASQQMVNIVSKIYSAGVTVELLLEFRAILHFDSNLKHEIINLLSHKEAISSNLLKLIILQPFAIRYLSVKALEELIQSDKFEPVYKYLSIMVKHSLKWNVPFKVNKLSDLKTKKKELAEKIDKIKADKDIFPSPPFPDTDNIKAIKTNSELIYWSKRQVNCSRDYGSAIRSGKKYLYKVILKNEEATLELNINNGQIRKGQLLATRNKSVSSELRLVVEEWFNKSVTRVL